MKIIKISFFMSLFALSVMGCRANTVIYSYINKDFDIEQSPLCDDETNPAIINNEEVTEFDIEENDENNSCFSNFKIISFSKLNNNYQYLIFSFVSNSSNYNFNFSLSIPPPRYLQVLRI